MDELATYPPAQDALLRRVLDEYGLIISGWSGEWDIALVRAMEEAKARRYPMFWVSYRQPSEAASRLIAQVGAVSIENTGADQLFVGLRDRLQSLDKLAAPPMSREMAVVRLKRYLPDPVHRIDTHDVIMDEVKRVEMLLLDRERYSMAPAPGTSEEFWARYDDRVTRYRADVDTLLHLLAAGAYFAGPEHNGLWTSVIQRLLSTQKTPDGQYNGLLFNLAQYPTLLAIHVVLTLGALAGRDDLAGPVLARPSLKLLTMQTEESAAYVTHPWRVFENDAANSLPRWTGTRFYFAPSHLIRSEIDEVVTVYEPDPERRKMTLDRSEYLIGLSQAMPRRTPYTGEYVLRGRYGKLPLQVSIDVRAAITESRSTLTQDLFGGDREAATAALDALDVEIADAANRAF